MNNITYCLAMNTSAKLVDLPATDVCGLINTNEQNILVVDNVNSALDANE